MFEVLGYIFAAIISIVILFFVYHIIKGAVVGASLTRWQLKTADWTKMRTIEYWPFKLVQLYFINWRLCVFYDGFTCHRGEDVWSGFGTGK
jgi:hypothetical protein